MKKKLFAVLMAAAMVFGMTACGSGESADTTAETTGDEAQLEDFSIVLDWYPNAVHAFLYDAIEKGYFAEEGLNLVIQFPANTNDGISLPAAGKADAGSARLLEIADSITELKTVCSCGSKAIVNARLDGEGHVITEGEQVMLGGNESYEPMCYKCWKKALEKEKEA